MQKAFRTRVAWIAAVGLYGAVGFSQTASSPPRSNQKGTARHASGIFEVTVKPETTADQSEGLPLGRLSLDKQYHGDLEGTGKGEMLTAGSSAGSGAYVAIERVSGTLHGRKGTFVLQHRGTMTRGGAPELTITVVPDSGTGQLAGLAGKMDIKISEGKHSYDFEYTLAETP
jgi:hypothetical protein